MLNIEHIPCLLHSQRRIRSITKTLERQTMSELIDPNKLKRVNTWEVSEELRFSIVDEYLLCQAQGGDYRDPDDRRCCPDHRAALWGEEMRLDMMADPEDPQAGRKLSSIFEPMPNGPQNPTDYA